MAVGSYNGSIYLIGGVAMQTLTKYSIDLNTLTHIEPVPWERGAFLLNLGQFWTQQDDIVYMSAYIINAGPQHIVSLDLATLVYSRISAAPQDLGSSFHGYYCLASSTDYIYVTGAYRIQNSNLLQVLQISTGQWTVGNRMNVGRLYHSCVVYGSFLYVFGGHVRTVGSRNVHTINLTSTERIDINQITSQNWSYAVPLIQAVIQSRAVSCGDKLFVLGGRGPDGYVNLAQIIDPLTQSISTQTMPYAAFAMGAICFEQDVYVLGGHGGKHENETLDSVFYYTEFTDDPTTDPITMRPTGHPTISTRDPSKVPTARTQHPTSLTLSPSIPPTNSTPITQHPTSLTLSPSVILTTANPTTSIPPTNSPQMTVDNVAGSNDAWIATLVSAIVSALVVVLIYCLYKYLKKKKQKVTEHQVVVMAANQNKPKPQQDSDVVKVNNKLDPQEDSSSSDDDSLYINKQSDITIDHEEGTAKNDTGLRQEEKSEKSSSCNSDGIYEGNEDSVSNSNQFREGSTQRTDNAQVTSCAQVTS
eukprot:791192_1